MYLFILVLLIMYFKINKWVTNQCHPFNKPHICETQKYQFLKFETIGNCDLSAVCKTEQCIVAVLIRIGPSLRIIFTIFIQILEENRFLSQQITQRKFDCTQFSIFPQFLTKLQIPHATSKFINVRTKRLNGLSHTNVSDALSNLVETGIDLPSFVFVK